MENKMVITTLSSRGQLTIPIEIRKALHIKNKGDIVGFEIKEDGVLMKRLVITEPVEDFSCEEWDKIENLTNKKGRVYANAKEFLASIEGI